MRTGGAGSGAVVPTPTRGIGIRSPWTTRDLSHIVWSDLIGTRDWPLSRAVAVGIPAVARARHILVGAIAGLPLRVLDAANEPVDPAPTWPTRTSDGVSPWHRMAWTVDDCFFSGWSLWVGDYGARDALLSAYRVPPDLWAFDPDGQVLIGNEPPSDPESLILIPGPSEGLLNQARSTLRAAIEQELYWQHRVRVPNPTVEIHQTTDDPMSEAEIDALLDRWVVARTDPDGTVTYTPHNIELRMHGDDPGKLLVEARNAVAVDIASHTGLPAALLNASLSTATLTYSTAETALGEIAAAARLYADPIEGRLSLDDVVPRGQRVAFDHSQLIAPSPYGPPRQD